MALTWEALRAFQQRQRSRDPSPSPPADGLGEKNRSKLHAEADEEGWVDLGPETGEGEVSTQEGPGSHPAEEIK